MNAIELLTQQHQEVRELFQEFEEADDNDEREELFQEIADNLAAHALIEEQIFYPAAYAHKTEDLLREAIEEHLAMKRIISDLLSMSPEDEQFEAKMTVLREQVEHHVEEEEKQLFKSIALGKEELETLGEQMMERFDDEIMSQPSENVPDEVQRAAPLPGK